jgi:hypothetical protein
MHGAMPPSINPSTNRTKAIVMQNIPIVAPQNRRTVSRGHGHGKM